MNISSTLSAAKDVPSTVTDTSSASMMVKTLDQEKLDGAAMVELIESAAPPTSPGSGVSVFA